MNKYLYAFLCICASIAFAKTADAQAPTAKISLNKSSGCSPIVVSFTDNSTGSPTSWSWNLGNGVTSTLQNPSTTYFSPGNYTIILTATNANGSSMDTATITVYASPTIAFTGDSLLSCPPKSVSFTNNTVAGGTSATYLWDFGDGDTSSLVNPSHIYTTTGNYSVSLVVTNNLGCTKTLTKNNYVKIDTVPHATFYVNNGTSCTTPLTASFVNNSTGATSYLWNFGDGTTSTAAAPSHTYTTNGSYNITLIAYNSNGCSDTLTRLSSINVGTLNANFTKSASSVCQGQKINFTNTTTPGTGTSIWKYGDGTVDTIKNGSHTYNTPGTYTVTLIELYSNCTDTTTQSVTILQKPTAQFTTNDTVGCGTPFSVTFTNGSSNANSYAWSFGDGTSSTATSPTRSYTSLGKFDVTLIATNSNGCKDTITKKSYIKNIVPTGQVLSQAYYGCAPINIAFDVYVDTPLYATGYTWNYGDGTGTTSCSSCSATHHTFNSAGTYTITATYNTSPTCMDTVTTNITVGSVPNSNFTASPTTVCTFDTVTFTNTSTGADSYEWHFGDGSQSNTWNPIYTYSNPGTYTVSLIAMDHGCRDTFTRTNYITVAGPIAKFVTSYNCANRLAYTFTDQSQYGQVYSWNFGDGNSSTQAGNVTHTYAAPGSYNVVLTVTDTVSMCSNTYDLTIGTYSLSAQFAANDTTICAGESAQFNAQASTIISKYIWNFGSGGDVTKTGNTITRNFATGGIYDIRLIVTDTAGCRDTLTKSSYMQVGGAKVALGATPTVACAPANIVFTDSSTANGGFAITSRRWFFGDGTDTTITGTTISHGYPVATSYSVTLRLTDANGCVNNKSIGVEVKKPTANFTANDTVACIGDSILFTNTSSGYSGTLNCLWEFGDGTTSTAFSPKHAYTSGGNFNVKLTITNSSGCTDSLIKTALINIQAPDAKFSMSDSVGACPPLTVYCADSSTGASSYYWTFGNNSSSTLSAPTAVYTYPGIYTIKQVITSSKGCKDSTTKIVTVYGPTGTLTYSPTTGCNPLTVSFSATSNNTTAYIWDMNNGVTQTTSGNSFSYTYTQAGRYLPKLILSDGGSCLVPVQGVDTIKVDYINGDFSFTSSAFCDSSTVQFTDTVYESISALTTRSWNFGDGSTSTAHNPSHKYTTSGNFTVTLILTNSIGCKDTIVKNVIINTSPSVNITTASASICQGQVTGVPLGVTGASTYVWSPATGLSCTNCATPTALPSSTTSYIVTGTDTNGCSNKDTIVITVNPQPTVSGGSDKTICVGGTVQLQGSGASTYTWSPSTGLSCTNCTSPNASPSSTSVYSVIGTDGNGCKDTANVTVTVSAKPTVSAGSNQSVCIGDSVALIATGASSYTWSPSSTLSCSTCDTTYASPTSTTTYTVIGTAGNNCADTSTVTVTVNNLPNVNAGTDKSICIGNSTTLSATGANTYVWTPATGLSCTNCTTPTTNTTTTTDYIVTGTDNNGCVNTDTIKVTVNPLPTVSAGNNVSICLNDSTQLTATGATTYTWTPAATLSCTNCASPYAKPTTTTTYTVTGTNANGCVDTATVIVSVNALPNVSAGPDKAVCNSTPAQLLATGATTYTWTPATGLSCTNCANPTATPSSTTTYIVTGTDTNACKNTDTVVVSINTLPTVSAGSNTSVCAGSSTVLTASGANTYTWSPATGLSCTNCTSPTATPSSTTTYTVTGTNANGCVNTAQVTITVNALPTINASNDLSVCAGQGANITATGGTSYTWSPATGLNCTNCQSPTATPSSTTTYVVNGVDANGCANKDSVKVTILSIPNVTASNDVSICIGDSTQLQASGSVNYTWAPTTGLSCVSCANPKAYPTTTTTYIVTGTSGNNCTDTAKVTVTVNALPTVNVGGNQSICLGDTIQVNTSGADTYSWTPTGSLSCSGCAAPKAFPTTTTTYTVTGVDTNGCMDTAQLNIAVKPIPVITLTPNTSQICEGDSVQLIAAGATTYSWSPTTKLSCTNCPTPTASPTSTITYVVTGTTNGCSDTAQATVAVIPKPNVSASADVDICIGDSTTLTVTGGVSNYSWSPSATLSCSNCTSTVAKPTNTTQYIVSGTDANNCTNRDTVTVTVHNPPAVNAGTDKQICNGETIQLTATGAVTYTWSPPTSLSCTNCTSPNASPTSNITYKVIGIDQYGCSDSDEVSLTVIQKEPVTFSADDTICLNESAQLLVTGGDSYQWSPTTGLSNALIANPVASPNTTTQYRVVVAQNNCFNDTGYINVKVNPLPEVDLGPDHEIKGGTSVPLLILGNNLKKFTWTPETGLSCTTCQSPVASPLKSITYTVVVENEFGCKASDNISIFVTCSANQLFLANTFTPNGDGINDRFYPQGKGVADIKRFSVYNRWGELIFDRTGMPLNDPISGWDGTFNGVPLKPDVFIYVISVICETGEPIQIKGDISLVR